MYTEGLCINIVGGFNISRSAKRYGKYRREFYSIIDGAMLLCKFAYSIKRTNWCIVIFYMFSDFAIASSV